MRNALIAAVAAALVTLMPTHAKADAHTDTPTPTWSIAIHGGAGTLNPDAMTPEKRAEYEAALQTALAPHPPESWGDVDITAAYQAARAEVFRVCPRREVPGVPGEAVLLHRHLVHGVAPWAEEATAPPEGRVIAYFRPVMNSVQDWLLQD